MTNPKTEKKGTPTLSKEELRTAREIHTLSHLIYSELAVNNPWVAPVHPPAGLQHHTVWPPTVPEAFVPTWPTPARDSW